jgi:ABC-type uncharacterized transport system ATPase subunit
LQSLDLAEVIALSDRIAVMKEGRIVVVLPREAATTDAVGAAMTGALEAVAATAGAASA